jgi:hypothetical protein
MLGAVDIMEDVFGVLALSLWDGLLWFEVAHRRLLAEFVLYKASVLPRFS